MLPALLGLPVWEDGRLKGGRLSRAGHGGKPHPSVGPKGVSMTPGGLRGFLGRGRGTPGADEVGSGHGGWLVVVHGLAGWGVQGMGGGQGWDAAVSSCGCLGSGGVAGGFVAGDSMSLEGNEEQLGDGGSPPRVVAQIGRGLAVGANDLQLQRG